MQCESISGITSPYVERSGRSWQIPNGSKWCGREYDKVCKASILFKCSVPSKNHHERSRIKHWWLLMMSQIDACHPTNESVRLTNKKQRKTGWRTDGFSILIQTGPTATTFPTARSRLRTRRFLSSKWGGWPQLKAGESPSYSGYYRAS